MKYARLFRVSLSRKKFRTALTIGSFAVAMFLFGLLAIVHLAFNQGVEAAGADRLIIMNRISFIQPLPISYMDRISQTPGIKEVTHASWFGGIYQDERNFFPQFAVDVSTWRHMYGEFKRARRSVEYVCPGSPRRHRRRWACEAVWLEGGRPHPD